MSEQAPTPPTPPTPEAKPLPAPRWTGSTAAALVHALIGLAAAAGFATEPPAAHAAPVWSGPAGLVSWSPLGPWTTWALIFGTPAAVVLAGRGRPEIRHALAALSVAWAALGGAALWVGLTSREAASFGGVACLGLWALCLLAALALGRRYR